MPGIRIIYPNPLDQSLRHDVVDVRLACSRRSDIRARGKNSRRKNKRGETGLSLSFPPPVFPAYNLTRSPLTPALYYLNTWNRRMFDVWATCFSCVPPQKDIRYSVSIAFVKIWTRDKIKPKHVQREFPTSPAPSPAVKWDQALFSLRRIKRAHLRHFMKRLPHTFLITWPSAETVVNQTYFPYMSSIKPEIIHFLVVAVHCLQRNVRKLSVKHV